MEASKEVVDALNEAIGSKANIVDLTDHTNNSYSVTKAQIGLDKVDNTVYLAKPISTIVQTALDTKLETSSVINTVTSTTKPLSVKMGKDLYMIG